jgi:stringent starvation protein B
MNDANRPLPLKKDVALALLQGPSMFIHLDPRKANVAVPPYFKKQPQLVLQVGLNMAIPIPDLQVDDDGVTCTLSFNRSPFWCKLPWSAVYALVGEDGRGMVWPSEVPAEVAAQMERAAAKQASEAPQRADGAGAGAPAPAGAGAPAQGPRSGRPRRNRAPGGQTGVAPLKPRESAAPATEKNSKGASPQLAPAPSGAASGGRSAPKVVPAAAGASAEPLSAGSGLAASKGPRPAPPAAAPTRGGGGKKGKRELPPYLRVVK